MADVIKFRKTMGVVDKANGVQEDGKCSAADIRAAAEAITGMTKMISDLSEEMEKDAKAFIEKNLKIPFSKCSLAPESAEMFMNPSAWTLDEDEKMLISPILTYEWEEDGFHHYFGTSYIGTDGEKEYALSYNYARINKTTDVMEGFDFNTGTWHVVEEFEENEDVEDIITEVAEKVIGNESTNLGEFEFIRDVAELFQGSDVEEITGLVSGFKNLMKLYGKTSNFMKIGYMESEDDPEDSDYDYAELDLSEFDDEDDELDEEDSVLIALTLDPDAENKHGCMIRSKNGKYVLQQYISAFSMIKGLDELPDGALDEICDEFDDAEYINTVAETDDAEAMAKLLEAMFGKHDKHEQFVFPLSMTAYLQTDRLGDANNGTIHYLDGRTQMTTEEKTALETLYQVAAKMNSCIRPE